MLRFTVEHKYCKCKRYIEGVNVWEAFRKNEMSLEIWNVLGVEQI